MSQILSLVDARKVALHALEKELKDVTRAVMVRAPHQSLVLYWRSIQSIQSSSFLLSVTCFFKKLNESIFTCHQVRRAFVSRALKSDTISPDDTNALASLPCKSFNEHDFYSSIEGTNCEAVVGCVDSSSLHSLSPCVQS